MEYQFNNPMNKTLLKLHDISLDYGIIKALKRINLSVDKGEIHAIVGEHGAGKSSLGMVISGMMKPKTGYIEFENNIYNFLTLGKSLSLGIEMVYQQNCLNPNFTVAENIFFADRSVNRFSFNNKKHLLDATSDLFLKYNILIDPSSPLTSLNLSDLAVVDIIKHISKRPKFLILDETLEKISIQSLTNIVNLLIQLKNEGMSILFITHRIDDVYQIAGKVTIIKDGVVLLTDSVNNIDNLSLMRLTYTQFFIEKNPDPQNHEFYKLLKYNEAILQKLPVNLIVTDNTNTIKIINESCSNCFKLEKSQYINSQTEVLFKKNNPEIVNLLNDNLSQNEDKILYGKKICINNINIICNLKIEPILDHGYVMGKIIVIEDVSENDKLQKQILLSEKLASIGLLAAGVAHEINNPLEIIFNYLSYIRFNFHNKKFLSIMNNLQDEMINISNIVSNLVAFSDNNTLDNEEFSLNELLFIIIDLLKYNANYNKIQIKFNSYNDDILIKSKRNEIKQVILNLFKNSFEAMPKGGIIKIKTNVIIDNDIPYAELIFSDTGAGIDDENTDNVFLPFYSKKKHNNNNLGLGLYVSYGIIKKYNGSISVKNKHPKGCVFTIRLPRHINNAS